MAGGRGDGADSGGGELAYLGSQRKQPNRIPRTGDSMTRDPDPNPKVQALGVGLWG